ncbi:hypothetical protein DYD21_18695 [Rhodohalobacter sp. SW132]|uniref:hypothetical protein n=1 Tax=Rhodohalobacter sp. SW132 TaxID=2293433 RepID=UPI000E24B57B|nr:hypothetical protein [Rhodohalobacter sp. SW132]REL24240.1 hypothetical protein DYD21_18695 [Rhodohalobacter sp. SW132]
MIYILLISLGGIAFTLYKTRTRIKDEGPFDEETEAHHPVAHIKSELFLEVPIERIVMAGFVIHFLSYAGLMVTGATLPGLELALLILSATVMLLLLFKQILVAGISNNFRWRVLALLIISAILTILIWNRPGITDPGLLENAQIYTLTVHLLGLVLGLGGAIILDLMIFHFLNNLKISSREAVIMHLISQMIILGLILLIVSGVALILTDPETYLENPRFLMKMTAVFIVTLNGVLLNLFVVPKMEQISFREEKHQQNTGLIRAAFIAGAVSMTSWFTVFILAMITPLENFSYAILLTGYIVLILFTIAGGLITKKIYERKDVSEA